MPSLHDLIDNIRSGKLWEPSFKKRLSDVYPDVVDWISKTAADAVCFDIGETADLQQLKIIPELFRFPYPVTWIEGRMRDGLVAILSAETGEQEYNLAIFNKRLGLAWQLVGVIDVFRANKDIHIKERVCLDETASEYLRLVAVNAGYFLMALNCTNIVSIEHPAPRFMNDKRVKKGKTPIYSYWTLHLPSQNQSAKPGTGTHASPRVHLRRGHVRQYAPGKYTWVEACVVGNKGSGVVEKDYAFHSDKATDSANDRP